MSVSAVSKCCQSVLLVSDVSRRNYRTGCIEDIRLTRALVAMSGNPEKHEVIQMVSEV